LEDDFSGTIYRLLVEGIEQSAQRKFFIVKREVFERGFCARPGGSRLIKVFPIGKPLGKDSF
jgi:hypothetical protein